MTETLDQKVGRSVGPTALSNPSGMPFLRGETRDERVTWSTLHLASAENAGCPTQGKPCKGTEAPY